MAYTIAFFGTKPYDEASFNDKNKEFRFEFRYYKGHLNKNNVLLTQGVDAVCIFDKSNTRPEKQLGNRHRNMGKRKRLPAVKSKRR